MATTDTPLRYPGGKSQLIPFVIDLMRENNLFYGQYAEPFAGGAGIAMKLLLDGFVDQIYINDIDPAIYAYWYSVLNHCDDFCEKINNVEVTIAEWHNQRRIYFSNENITTLAKGFATFFLNRTNRSGIIKAGVIGGLKQNGNYKIDCRFVKVDLIRKVRRIAAYRDQIHLSGLDAITFLETVIPFTAPNTLVNLDPPYFEKGQALYTNFYKLADHAMLAETVHSLKKPWMITYDDTPEIRALYARYSMYNSKLNYSAQTKRIGTELLVLNPTLNIPKLLETIKIETLPISGTNTIPFINEEAVCFLT